MSDFLLELRSEEIPARMQAGARADLEKLFRSAMKDAGVTHGEITVWSTPRRLALIARDLPAATEAVREEVKGPKTSAPVQALEGFLRKTGLTQEQLTERDGIWFAVSEKPGRTTIELLSNAIPAIIRTFAWPKSMRWGSASITTESPRWVRPLSGIVALFDGKIVPCEFGGVVSGRETVGHRFHAPADSKLSSQSAGFSGSKVSGSETVIVSAAGTISIDSADDYERKLFIAKVMVNQAHREMEIRIGAHAAALGAGLRLVEDEGLVIENAGLTEWPVPLLGRFDPTFLEVPPEVIQLTARTNQKYFICRTSDVGDQDSPLPLAGGAGGGQPQSAEPEQPTPNPSRKRAGDLANAFVCTANIAASDGGTAIIDGNRKVLAARLSDARFFWQQDRKVPLAEHAKKLERITFHEKLGTVADKVERVAKLARWLVEEGIVKSSPSLLGEGDRAKRGGGAPPSAAIASATSPSKLGEDLSLADHAVQAARLCKADLVTEMVGEFPELQGLMGGYYARAEGLPDAVADAIRDHYKPVGQGDEVPTAPVTVAVSLADKLDTLTAFITIGEFPTGSRDPFALRRAAISIIRLILINNLRFGLHLAAIQAFAQLFDRTLSAHDFYDDQKSYDVLSFIADRLKVQQREAGVRHDLIDAVFALGGEDDLVRLLARVHALQALIGTEDGVNLLAGYKRAANILKKEAFEAAAGAPFSLSYTPEPAEKALVDSLAQAGPRAATAVEAEDFAGAMAALATLRRPIDAFFDSVTVNDPAPEKRLSRLALLDSFRAAVHKVADFSKIEGQ